MECFKSLAPSFKQSVLFSLSNVWVRIIKELSELSGVLYGCAEEVSHWYRINLEQLASAEVGVYRLYSTDVKSFIR